MNPSKKLSSFIPKDFQKSPSKNIIAPDPTKEKLEFDALFVGAGPASLAGAIRLAQLSEKKLQIAVLEKASKLGGHSLSGAIVNPIAFKRLFPDLKMNEAPFRLPVQKEKMYALTQKKFYRIPSPPTMQNKGFYTASLCEVVRWLGQKAEELGIHIFPSTAANKLIVDNNRAVGVQTQESGLDKNKERTSQYQPAVNIFAESIFLGDGARGNLSQSWLRWKNISSHYPEHYVLGVKEVWKVKKAPVEVFHTVGWPLENFGGSFLYPLSKNLVSLGLCGSLHYTKSNWNLNSSFQQMKTHPLFANILKEGECLEWGAKIIPEGGFHSIPQTLSDDHVFLIGDSAQLVNVPSLKGIHYGMLSGLEAVESFFKKEPLSYTKKIKKHKLIGQELYKVRNVVQILQTENKWIGFLKAGLSILSKGLLNFKIKKLQTDSEVKRTVISEDTSSQNLSKQDAVYLSGNKTRDDIPVHLKSLHHLPSEVIHFYKNFCPAGVYEEKDGQMTINAPNCVDCKATDVLGPRWSPREGGSGPQYDLM